MKRFQRLTLAAALGLALAMLSGCGSTFRQSIRDGIYGYVSGSLSSGLISTQFSSFISDLLLPGTQS